MLEMAIAQLSDLNLLLGKNPLRDKVTNLFTVMRYEDLVETFHKLRAQVFEFILFALCMVWLKKV